MVSPSDQKPLPALDRSGHAVAEEHEPCPTPLDWREVVEAYTARVDEGSVEIGGARLRVRALGDGPPVYILPGSLGTSDLYILSAWLLREDYRTVLLDWPDAQVGRDWAGALELVTDAMGEERLRLYATGVSVPGALDFAIRRPERVESLALQSGMLRRRHSIAERVLLRLGSQAPGRAGRLPTWHVLQQGAHQPWFPPYDQTRWTFFQMNVSETPIQRMAQLARQAARPIDVEKVRALEHPVLLIRCEGEGGRAVEYQDELARLLPRAHQAEMHTTGVYPYLTHPHRLVKLLRSFLDGQPLAEI